ncbi:MAG: hypothetical protein K6F80_05180 [Oscillospiraceae bacterium]|nr:hypothetical protein [Oscillospiraceae bacterium]
MKAREIILDFTSLLDVIMIILFWFILNYQNETTRIRDRASAAEQAASEAQSIAELREQNASEQLQITQDELDALENVNARQASILRAVNDYRRGRTLNLTLCCKKNYWYLQAAVGQDDVLGRIDSDDEQRLSLELRQMLSDAGFADDETVFCVLSYDSDEPGSRDAYNSVIRELKEIQLGNHQFSFTQIDRFVEEDVQ